MELISVTDFLNLTSLSRGDLLTMLERGEVRGAFSEAGELKIDIGSLTPEDIARRSASETSAIDAETKGLIEEIVASEIAAQLDSILDEALELTLEWDSKKGT